MKKFAFILITALALLAACEAEPEIREVPGDIIDDGNGLSLEEAQEIAREFVRNSPTFAYDGSDLQLIDQQVLESFPVQYLFTYNFTSSHGGYGNRAGQVVIQAITPHTAMVRVSNGEVTSAVLDGYWNMMAQEPINISEDPDEPITNAVQISYQPEQCEGDLWDTWYAEGNINFIREPTEAELIQAYYSDRGIGLSNVEMIEPERVVCQACGCPTVFYFTAITQPQDVNSLEGDGWGTA